MGKKKNIFYYIFWSVIGIWTLIGLMVGLVLGGLWLSERILIPEWVAGVVFITFVGSVFGAGLWNERKEKVN